jgi:hypothetical protein
MKHPAETTMSTSSKLLLAGALMIGVLLVPAIIVTQTTSQQTATAAPAQTTSQQTAAAAPSPHKAEISDEAMAQIRAQNPAAFDSLVRELPRIMVEVQMSGDVYEKYCGALGPETQAERKGMMANMPNVSPEMAKSVLAHQLAVYNESPQLYCEDLKNYSK